VSAKKFDLNVEKILEDWEVYHAVREVIANAIDEQILTGTKDIEIFKDEEGRWHIRDYGRGLKYEHLTQKENEEKLKHPNLIGKFGVGLKDALATFDRKGVKVYIKSRYGDITLGKSSKHDFEDIITLHAYIHPPSDPNFVGTEFILDGVTDEDIEKAKSLFLKFSGEKVIESTRYGEVLEKKGRTANIYINGVKVAEEENFLFSYNITSLTSAIKKALNRERTNVGRSAYSDRVKQILLSCKSKMVAEKLVKDLENYKKGTIHDELNWIDVAVHACRLLNSMGKVLFLTPEELMEAPDIVDKAKIDGFKIVTIPKNVRDKIRKLKDVNGQPMRDINQFQKEWNESFEFKFVSPDELTLEEKAIFDMTEKILQLAGGKPKNVREIKISETMRIDPASHSEAEGIWEPLLGRIVIKRSVLKSLESYASTLLHEIAHARSGASDVSRQFEDELSRLLGVIVSNVLRN